MSKVNSNLLSVSRRMSVVVMAMLLVFLGSCKSGKNDKDRLSDDLEDEELVDEDVRPQTSDLRPQTRLEGHTFYYGDHSYTLDDGLRMDGDMPNEAEGQMCTVTFTHFPASIDEFRALQEQLLGNRFGGCLALNVMAYEMFRRDRALGEEAIRIVNTPTNANQTLSTLGQKFSTTRYDENDNDSYHQPYLVAAFLKGATHDNKYQPDYPYVLRFCWNKNPYMKQHEYSNILYGYIYRLVALRNGENECNAEVLVDEDNPSLLRISNCPSFYYAVPNIRHWDDTLK